MPAPSPKSATLAADPQLVALLVFLLGGDCDREASEGTINDAIAGARELLDSDPFVTAFDEFAQRANVYDTVSESVQRGLSAADAVSGEEKRQAVAVLR